MKRLLLVALLFALPAPATARPFAIVQEESCPQCGTKPVGNAKFCHECGLDLRAETDAHVYHNRRLGIRLDTGGHFKIRTRDFKRGWGSGTLCELESEDGKANGVITYFVWGAGAKAFADWREGTWKSTEGVTNVRRRGDRPLRKPYGEWLRAEISYEYKETKWRYLETFVGRGSRNIELALWTQEAHWDDWSRIFVQVADALEFYRVWRCGGCGADIAPDARACAGCRRPLVAPNADLERLCRKYGIQLILSVDRFFPVKTAGGTVATARNAPRKKIEEFCDVLARELAKYPEELFRRLQLERIILCREMKRDGVLYGGLSVYDFDGIVFEISEGWDLPHFIASKVHHELYHFIDYRDDLTTERDDEWAKLNEPGFRYDPKKQAYGGLDNTQKGFLNTYSHTGVGEDKAEVFGYSVAAPAAVRERAEHDPVLKRKAARMRELARAYCQELDDDFWARLER